MESKKAMLEARFERFEKLSKDFKKITTEFNGRREKLLNINKLVGITNSLSEMTIHLSDSMENIIPLIQSNGDNNISQRHSDSIKLLDGLEQNHTEKFAIMKAAAEKNFNEFMSTIQNKFSDLAYDKFLSNFKQLMTISEQKVVSGNLRFINEEELVTTNEISRNQENENPESDEGPEEVGQISMTLNFTEMLFHRMNDIERMKQNNQSNISIDTMTEGDIASLDKKLDEVENLIKDLRSKFDSLYSAINLYIDVAKKFISGNAGHAKNIVLTFMRNFKMQEDQFNSIGGELQAITSPNNNLASPANTNLVTQNIKVEEVTTLQSKQQGK